MQVIPSRSLFVDDIAGTKPRHLHYYVNRKIPPAPQQETLIPHRVNKFDSPQSFKKRFEKNAFQESNIEERSAAKKQFKFQHDFMYSHKPINVEKIQYEKKLFILDTDDIDGAKADSLKAPVLRNKEKAQKWLQNKIIYQDNPFDNRIIRDQDQYYPNHQSQRYDNYTLPVNLGSKNNAIQYSPQNQNQSLIEHHRGYSYDPSSNQVPQNLNAERQRIQSLDQASRSETLPKAQIYQSPKPQQQFKARPISNIYEKYPEPYTNHNQIYDILDNYTSSRPNQQNIPYNYYPQKNILNKPHPSEETTKLVLPPIKKRISPTFMSYVL